MQSRNLNRRNSTHRISESVNDERTDFRERIRILALLDISDDQTPSTRRPFECGGLPFPFVLPLQSLAGLREVECFVRGQPRIFSVLPRDLSPPYKHPCHKQPPPLPKTIWRHSQPFYVNVKIMSCRIPNHLPPHHHPDRFP